MKPNVRLTLPYYFFSLMLSLILILLSLPSEIEIKEPTHLPIEHIEVVHSNEEVWGQTGHRVVGQIAEAYLSKKAKKEINRLLEGHSLAFASTIADEIKSDRAYDSFGPWHYVNYEMGGHYDPTNADERGDIVYGIQKSVEILESESSSDADKRFYLKLLIHFIGDLHQPLHVGRAEDQGGNRIQVSWFSRTSNLHRVWDSDLIDGYSMGYDELAQELLRSTTKEEHAPLAKGTYLDWVEESHQIVERIYASASSGDRLGYRYTYDFNPLLFEQLAKGGIRLAKVLNELFD
jgi:hypothetical protein